MLRPDNAYGWYTDSHMDANQLAHVLPEAYDGDPATSALLNCGVDWAKNLWGDVWFFSSGDSYVESVTVLIRATSTLAEPPEMAVRHFDPANPNVYGEIIATGHVLVAASPVTVVMKIPKIKAKNVALVFRPTVHKNAECLIYDIRLGDAPRGTVVLI
jgi:hypothetical protein